MKVRLLSDIHLEFESNYIIKHNGEDILILAGDIHYEKEIVKNFIISYLNTVPENNLPYNCLLVLGNHDYYHNNIYDIEQYYKNLNIPKFKALINDTIEINYNNKKYVFIGSTLWSDFSKLSNIEKNYIESKINDYKCINNINIEYLQSEFLKNKEYIENMVKKYQYTSFGGDNVISLITHHLPSYKSIDPKYYSYKILNHAFYSNLDYLSEYIHYFFHGHTHSSCDYKINKINNSRVICNPKGYYNENKLYNDNLIINI